MIKNRICFVAGKSGGHIIPCLTLAAHYKTHNETMDVTFFSTNTSLDKLILSTNDLVTRHITLSLSSINPRSFFHIFTIGWNIISSLFFSFFYLCAYRPSQIISTGGVVALPVCIAGFFLRIPIILYSLDAVPGKAIKALIPFSTHIMFCFKNSQKFFPTKKCTFTSFPLRYANENIILSQQDALSQIGLTTHKKTILILGGSQGSLFLNNCIKELIKSPYFTPADTQIIHQTGSLDSTNWIHLYKQHNIDAHVFSYHPQLALMYIAADIIISRAGAGTLFEIQFFNKQCLVIPLRTKTTTHQVDNAHMICQDYPHLFQCIDQNDIEQNQSHLFLKINEILNSKKS